MTVIALTGGIGGAKLALGLYRELPPDSLTLVCNTADDFEHLGLHISPDIDTILYTLAGLSSPKRGWGRRNETWTFMKALASLGGETWFQLGDGDLAMHVERTRRLASSETLAQVTHHFAQELKIHARIFPMSDDFVRTAVITGGGRLPFQHYFVKEQCRPAVEGFEYEGAAKAKPMREVIERLGDPRLKAVIICPSNPFLSIEPILAVRGIAQALTACKAPVIAVSPLIGGRAVKGPTAKIMKELGFPAEPSSILQRYRNYIDGIVIDQADRKYTGSLGIPCLATATLMRTLRDKRRLARTALEFAKQLAQK